ncbi:hypothetical protein NEFER03_0299 [Nematocida sp. LUAm3]|nr:hypothetical protein NEFER03_0299 [Nematocida sp. LUAm3]KAI5173751.1 hypothetical protein NEFER02_0267 [Nematocida sp. LUAm2]KAI5176974.1 hypothetical protein NEFER01_0299 [Nematocida sp. LUAm1]
MTISSKRKIHISSPLMGTYTSVSTSNPLVDASASTSNERAVNTSSNAHNSRAQTHSVIEVMQEERDSTSCYDKANQKFTNISYNYVRCFISITVLNILNIYRIVWPFESIYNDSQKNYIDKIIEYVLCVEGFFFAINLIAFQAYICRNLATTQPNQKRPLNLESMIIMVFMLAILSIFSIFLIFVLLYIPISNWTSPNMDIFYLDRFVDIIILSIHAPIVFVSFFSECKRKNCYKNKKVWCIIVLIISLLAFIYTGNLYLSYIGTKRFLAYRNGDLNYAKIIF